MTKLVFISITALMLFSCSGENNSPENSIGDIDFERNTSNYETIDEFGEQIFKLIQLDDYNSILDLMPDLTEYKFLINESSLPSESKERTINGLENKLKENIQSLKRTYSMLKEKTEESGIDWSKSELDYIDYNHIKKDRIESANIYLNFNFKGVNYKIELRECVKIGNTWLIGNKINWKSSNGNGYSSKWD